VVIEKKEQALALLRRQWCAMLTAHAEGADVAAAEQWRCEGFMDACAQLELLSPEEQDAAFGDLCQEIRDYRPVALADWRTMHPFPALPLWQNPAPVKPSTKVRVEWLEPDQG
jgi:hypothetical protein